MRKSSNSFVMSVRLCSVHPSVCPHGTTQHPLNGSWWNLVFKYFWCMIAMSRYMFLFVPYIMWSLKCLLLFTVCFWFCFLYCKHRRCTTHSDNISLDNIIFFSSTISRIFFKHVPSAVHKSDLKYIKSQQNSLQIYDVFYSHYSHQHVSTGISAIFRVMVTQVPTSVCLYLCNNNITLKMAVIPTETCWWERCE